MRKEKCITCSEYKRCRDSYASWIFFIIGLIATIAVRVVTVLINLNPVYGKTAWYIGVIGFFLFFIYKFRVSQQRSRLIAQSRIASKLNQQKQLSSEDYKLMSAIICGINSQKERINYFFIFGLSFMALILAIYMDFIK